MQNLVFRNRLKTEKDSPNQQINQNLCYAVVHKVRPPQHKVFFHNRIS